MQLEDFVFETLKQVVNGIRRAKESGAELGANISPSKVSFYAREGAQETFVYDPVTHRPIEKISFDVAVVASEGSKDKGGAGIFVAGFGLGAQSQSESANQTISRVKFSVPILYP